MTRLLLVWCVCVFAQRYPSSYYNNGFKEFNKHTRRAEPSAGYKSLAENEAFSSGMVNPMNQERAENLQAEVGVDKDFGPSMDYGNIAGHERAEMDALGAQFGMGPQGRAPGGMGMRGRFGGGMGPQGRGMGGKYGGGMGPSGYGPGMGGQYGGGMGPEGDGPDMGGQFSGGMVPQGQFGGGGMGPQGQFGGGMRPQGQFGGEMRPQGHQSPDSPPPGFIPKPPGRAGRPVPPPKGIDAGELPPYQSDQPEGDMIEVGDSPPGDGGFGPEPGFMEGREGHDAPPPESFGPRPGFIEGHEGQMVPPTYDADRGNRPQYHPGPSADELVQPNSYRQRPMQDMAPHHLYQYHNQEREEGEEGPEYRQRGFPKMNPSESMAINKELNRPYPDGSPPKWLEERELLRSLRDNSPQPNNGRPNMQYSDFLKRKKELEEKEHQQKEDERMNMYMGLNEPKSTSATPSASKPMSLDELPPEAKRFKSNLHFLSAAEVHREREQMSRLPASKSIPTPSPSLPMSIDELPPDAMSLKSEMDFLTAGEVQKARTDMEYHENHLPATPQFRAVTQSTTTPMIPLEAMAKFQRYAHVPPGHEPPPPMGPVRSRMRPNKARTKVQNADNSAADAAYPVKDDFGSPIMWVKLSSNATRDGLAKVTDPKTKINYQVNINGTIYVPVADTRLERLGFTTKAPTTKGITEVPKSALETLTSVIDMKTVEEKDWLAIETSMGGRSDDPECDGDSCQSRCMTYACETKCQGDTCAAGCVGKSCSSTCIGPGCMSMCIGESCEVKCDGQACEARCIGPNCKATCASFGCSEFENNSFKRGGGTFDQHYPQYSDNNEENIPKVPNPVEVYTDE